MVVFSLKTAIKNRQKEIIFSVPREIGSDIERTFSNFFPILSSLLRKEIVNRQKGYGIRTQLRFKIKLKKFSFEQDRDIIVEQWFPSDSLMLVTLQKISSVCKQMISQVLSRYDAFVQTGSGWNLCSVKSLSLSIMRFKLFTGGSKTSGSLPKKLQNCSSLIDPPGKTNCFAMAVAIGISQRKRNASRSCQLYEDIVAVMPDYVKGSKVSLTDIEKFERDWPISCNIYGFEKNFFPFYVSPYVGKRKFHVPLLLHKSHFYLIRNLSALVKKTTLKNRRKCFVCEFCFTYFNKEEKYNTHKNYCQTKSRPIEMPDPSKNSMQFKNFANLLEAPFVIYADLESSIDVKILSTKKDKTLSTAPHKTISFACLTVCRENEKFSSSYPVIYTGKNAIDKFLDCIEKEISRINKILLNVNIPLEMSPTDRFNFETARRCHFCLREFLSCNFVEKVRDHSHLSGKFRFALCSRCNLTHAKTKLKVVVILHGLCNYDSHFIIQKLNRYPDTMLKVIPRTGEKYLSFSVGDVIFKDSFQFISESLSTLASNLRNKGSECFFSLNKYIQDKGQRKLLTKKGIFPYTYITSLKVLKERKLPPKSYFYNDLAKEHISEEDYQFALEVWKKFNCKNLKDYLEVYLLADLLLLSDVFENFRTNCYKNYELDPLHYYSNAHFTFDAFLRFSGAKLELLTDPNMYLFISKGIRGGLSMVGKRISTANNKYMGEKYDASKPSSYIMYFDCNNLYGVAMKEFLPHSEFHWKENFTEEDVLKILQAPADAETGYILEVDIVFPEEFHSVLSDYPLAPEKRKISFEELSPYSQMVVTKHNLKTCKVEKLLATLMKKENYVLHYRNFQLYTSLGAKVVKIHRILQFYQKPSLKEYIDFNTAKRAASTNVFDINFYKFLSNSLFGKTMERPENKTHVKLVNQVKTYEKYVAKLNFKNSKIINKNLVGIEMNHLSLKINKPFYLGMAIMDISKCHMYEFHYNVMKKHFGENMRLLYTDTDSLIYEIFSEDVYEELKEISQHFDFSNYPKNSCLYSDCHKKIPGYFKDECGGKIVEKFVGLRSKMYSLKVLDEQEVKVAKGVKTPVIKKELSFEDYEACLREEKELEHDFFTLRSNCHQVCTTHQSKKSLSPFDDKRWLLNNLDSLPYGHKNIPEIKRCIELELSKENEL